jgi:hypothetical protein
MNKTKAQRINPQQVKQFFADAQKRAVAARKNLAIDAEAAYEIAYEAMIKGSLALMLSHGQRPRKQPGHHIAIIEFAQKTCLAAHPRRSFCLTICAASATTPSTMWRLSVIQMPRKLFQPQSNSCGLLRLISRKEIS